MRRGRHELLVVAALVGVLGLLATISFRGGASSASTVAPSARPAAAAFAQAYTGFLGGRLSAGSVPYATTKVRSVISAAGLVPKAYRNHVSLQRVAFTGVLGASRASALLYISAGSRTGGASARTLEAEITLAYAHSRWQVTSLVPPDFPTVFSPPARPVSVPAATRSAAAAFAVAYTDFRTGAVARPPAGLSTIERQIAAHQDPLAHAAHTRAGMRLVRLEVLPQGQTAAVSAVLAAAHRRLAFTFLLLESGGRWQPWAFPVSTP